MRVFRVRFSVSRQPPKLLPGIIVGQFTAPKVRIVACHCILIEPMHRGFQICYKRRGQLIASNPWSERFDARTFRDRAGIGLFLVDRGASGVTLRDYRTVDGLRAAEVAFEDVRVGADAVLGDPQKRIS